MKTLAVVAVAGVSSVVGLCRVGTLSHSAQPAAAFVFPHTNSDFLQYKQHPKLLI